MTNHYSPLLSAAIEFLLVENKKCFLKELLKLPEKMTGSMRIIELTPQADWKLKVVADDGRIGIFDVRPYLEFEAFEELKDISEFKKVKNRGYFVEWESGADLSSDTIDARMKVIGDAHVGNTA